MLNFLIGRVSTGVLVLFVVSVVTFLLVALIPGNAARTILGLSASPAAVAQLAREMHLSAPLQDQYWSWLKGPFIGTSAPP